MCNPGPTKPAFVKQPLILHTGRDAVSQNPENKWRNARSETKVVEVKIVFGGDGCGRAEEGRTRQELQEGAG